MTHLWSLYNWKKYVCKNDTFVKVAVFFRSKQSSLVQIDSGRTCYYCPWKGFRVHPGPYNCFYFSWLTNKKAGPSFSEWVQLNWVWHGQGLHDLDAIPFPSINTAFKVKDEWRDPQLREELRFSKAVFCHIRVHGEN